MKKVVLIPFERYQKLKDTQNGSGQSIPILSGINKEEIKSDKKEEDPLLLLDKELPSKEVEKNREIVLKHSEKTKPYKRPPPPPGKPLRKRRATWADLWK